MRNAALGEIYSPADRLTEAAQTPHREDKPELFLDPLAAIDQIRALLDAIGWCEPPDGQRPVTFNIDPYRELVIRVMNVQLSVEREMAAEAASTPDDQSAIDEQRDTALRRAELIEDFLSANGLPQTGQSSSALEEG